MAAAAADAPNHIATLTLEDEDRRGATKVFGGPAAGRTERETESEREREREGRGSGNECLVCGALFSSQDKLRLHAFCHAGEKPFHCSQPHCPKAFSSKYKLFRLVLLAYKGPIYFKRNCRTNRCDVILNLFFLKQFVSMV